MKVITSYFIPSPTLEDQRQANIITILFEHDHDQCSCTVWQLVHIIDHFNLHSQHMILLLDTFFQLTSTSQGGDRHNMRRLYSMSNHPCSIWKIIISGQNPLENGLGYEDSSPPLPKDVLSNSSQPTGHLDILARAKCPHSNNWKVAQ
jgi:hypothetical protein